MREPGDDQPTLSHPQTAADDFAPPTAAQLAPLFGQLEILRLLGHGGMGAVYLARQKSLDRPVALKIIRPESAGIESFAQRFSREAKALARLNHPNIVGVHEFGSVALPVATDTVSATDLPSAPELYFLVMEYVDGANLRQLIADQSLTPREAMAIVPQICEALQFAHDLGIVHRDIKPENILIDRAGRVKIADFGLAKLVSSDSGEQSLTGTHQVMGTLRYMAPEQLEQSRSIDHRADIYSLGVVFYEMLTGELPIGVFEPPSSRVQIDVRLDAVVLRSLAKDPQRRYQQASEIKTDVDACASDEDGSGKRQPPIAAAKSFAAQAPLPSSGQLLLIVGVGLLGLGVLLIPASVISGIAFFGIPELVLMATFCVIMLGVGIGLIVYARRPSRADQNSVTDTAKSRLAAPANSLLVYAIIYGVVFSALFIFYLVPKPHLGESFEWTLIFQTRILDPAAAYLIWVLLAAGTIVLAAIKMKALQSYRFVIVGTLVAPVSALFSFFIGPVVVTILFIVAGLVIGVWCLVVLSDSNTRQGFAPQPITWRTVCVWIANTCAVGLGILATYLLHIDLEDANVAVLPAMLFMIALSVILQLTARPRNESEMVKVSDKSQKATSAEKSVRRSAAALTLVGTLGFPALILYWIAHFGYVAVSYAIPDGTAGGYDMIVNTSASFGVISGVFTLTVIPIVLIAAARMRSCQQRGLAITGSALVMLPLSITALAGIPIGLWSLVVLMRDDVREAFARSSVPVETTCAQLKKAGTWLLVSGGISVLLSLIPLVIVLTWVGSSMFGLASLDMMSHASVLSSTRIMAPIAILSPSERLQLLMMASPAGVITLMGAMQLFGAIKLRKLSSYRWSMCAAILGLIPYSPAWFVSLPASIYALAVLGQKTDGVAKTAELFSASPQNHLKP